MLIKYVAFYDINPETSSRNVSPAAVSKVNYIASSLRRIGHDIEIISTAWRVSPEKLRRVDVSNDGFSIKFAPSFGYFGPINSIINALIVNIWLFYKLVCCAQRHEKILVYHSLVIMPAIFTAKIIKSLDVVLEVEELYTSVGNWHPISHLIESYYIRNVGSQFVLSTEMLQDFIPKDKLSTCVYGSYYLPIIPLAKPNNKSTPIKLLYAGIIDENKRGAFNAVDAALFLNDSYELHIIGFGEVDKLLAAINECNLKSRCKVFYDGFMTGRKFEEYCFGFDIGLSTQVASGAYLSSSFPSKVLTYLSYGMRVVSPYIACVARSSVGKLVFYYYEDSPEAIARSVMAIKFNDGFDCASEIQKLDIEFCQKMKSFFVIDSI